MLQGDIQWHRATGSPMSPMSGGVAIPLSGSRRRVTTSAGLALTLMVETVILLSVLRLCAQVRRRRPSLAPQASELIIDERRRFAANLHNGVLQDLTGIMLDLAGPDSVTGSAGLADRATIAVRLRAAIASLRDTMSEIHPIAPSGADVSTANVSTAIRAALDRLDAHLARHLEIDTAAEPRPEHRWLVIRVAQEALWNVGVHAHAKSVTVELRQVDHNVVLTVRDDGDGFDTDFHRPLPGHMGLVLLADIAAASGASLTVESALGTGTTVRLCVPK